MTDGPIKPADDRLPLLPVETSEVRTKRQMESDVLYIRIVYKHYTGELRRRLIQVGGSIEAVAKEMENEPEGPTKD